MTGTGTSPTAEQAPQPIKVLRERRGGVPRELVERNKEVTRLRQQVTAALSAGPRTVPQIAAETGIPADIVFWHVVSMRKYGQVTEGEPNGDYFEYALKEGR